MPVTMKDIAEKAGVSSATVSKILNGVDQHISERTRQRVLKIVEDMGYVPNNAARSLKTKSSRLIGFILPDIANPFFPEIVRGVEDTARSYNYALVICNTDNDPINENKVFQFLNARMVDGIIFTHSLQSIDQTLLKKIGVPAVIVDRKLEGSWIGIGQVFINQENAFYDSTSLLIKKGRKNIIFISADYGSVPNHRLEGYKNALRKAHLKYRAENVFLGKYDAETGRSAIDYFLKKGTLFNGVVCGNDMIAFGVLDALHRHGKKIPKDVSVIGFDDITFSKYTTPALTTVHQPAYEMGAEAMRMLIENITQGKPMIQKKLSYYIQNRETL